MGDGHFNYHDKIEVVCEDCESQYTNLSIAHKSKVFLKIKPKINDFNGKILPNFDSKKYDFNFQPIQRIDYS